MGGASLCETCEARELAECELQIAWKRLERMYVLAAGALEANKPPEGTPEYKDHLEATLGLAREREIAYATLQQGAGQRQCHNLSPLMPFAL